MKTVDGIEIVEGMEVWTWNQWLNKPLKHTIKEIINEYKVQFSIGLLFYET